MAGTEGLAALFADDARYLTGPYDAPVVGLADLARMWDEKRTDDEVFEMTSEVVAVDGDTAVVRVEVHYTQPVVEDYRDLWVIRFAVDGRCQSFEEWPFWPTKPLTASTGPA